MLCKRYVGEVNFLNVLMFSCNIGYRIYYKFIILEPKIK